MNRAILYRMPAGFAGDVTRKENSIIEPGILGSDVALGAPVKISGGKLVALTGGEAATDIYGFLVRPYPTQGGISGLTVAGKLPSGSACDVLRLGYMSVPLARGTAVKAAKPYVRVVADGAKLVGDIEAALDPAVKSIAGEAEAGNAGNGTIGTLTVAAKAKVGDYAVVFTAATAFDVTDPDGLPMGSGVSGTAFSAGGIAFTITAGLTPNEAADAFTVTVTEAAAKTVALNAGFMGAADADGNVEIAYNI
jgi:hypothetical protein